MAYLLGWSCIHLHNLCCIFDLLSNSCNWFRHTSQQNPGSVCQFLLDGHQQGSCQYTLHNLGPQTIIETQEACKSQLTVCAWKIQAGDHGQFIAAPA